MKGKPIIALMGGVGLLLFIAILFVVTRHPAITVRKVRYVKSVQGESAARFVTFEVANRTDRWCRLRPVSVEVRHGSSWERCFEFARPYGAIVSLSWGRTKSVWTPDPIIPIFGPHEYGSSTLKVGNLPLGSPLRLRFTVSEELLTLEGLFRRLDLRFRQGVKQIPLNPFDKSTRIYSKEIPIVSQEFIEPDSNHTEK